MRDKILALASLAASDGTPEHEATTAARILAKMIHANPEVIASGASLPEGANAIDPLLGYAIRQGFDVASDLFRDLFARRPRRAAVKCLAVLDGDGTPENNVSLFCQLPIGHTDPHRSAFGHTWPLRVPGDPPRPGPRKARNTKRQRA
jgi:hypothetical protein